MRNHSIVRKLNTITYAIATTLLVTACGRDSACADVGLARLSVTDTTIVVGQSFVVGIENGGGCVNIPNSDSFGPPSPPSPNITGYWSTLDTAIVSVDSVSGQVIGKRIGDAIVKPTVGVTTGSHTLAVHVR
ncbi:MAG TPA: hypothetical protein VII66_00145 [Gemmatimonadaceae bacterium]